MFNLLMSGIGWDTHRDSLNMTRVFEYTSADLMARFKPNNVLDIAAVSALPTLLASETGHLQKPARVVRLTRVRLNGVNFELEYVVDADIPPIPHEVLEAMGVQLQVTGWEWSRSHWAIKDVDLFEVLLKHGIGTIPRPTAFVLAPTVESDLVAVMMPFDARFSPVIDALRAAAAAVDLRCERANDIWVADQVIQDVASLISKAKIVVCDLTGKNPNVFYEMGIAHTLGKDVIMVTQSPQDVPFDVNHIRYLTYLPNAQGYADLTVAVTRRFQTLLNR